MRLLLGIVCVVALLWSGYWLIGARVVERDARGWLDAQAAEGWIAHADSVRTAGFPNRFDTTFTALELADPQTGVAWSAPFFQILRLSYRPHHVILVWPEKQSVASPEGRVQVTSRALRGSVVVAPGQDLALRRATMAFDTLGLAAESGWTASLADGQVAVRQAETMPAGYDIALSAGEIALPGRVTRLLSERGLASDALAALSLEATVTFDVPWDRAALEERRPQPREIDIDLAAARWGALDLQVAGRVSVDADGRPDGALTVKATNWREILALATAAGIVPEGLGGLLETGLARMARLAGDPRTLDIPLRIDRGRVTLGGVVPLGTTPRLRLR